MAKSSQLMEEISEQFLICTICCEMYKTPKTLNCMHTFCELCLEKHLESQQERTYRYMLYTRNVSCPVCRKKTDVPNGGLRKLPDSFLLSNLIDILERRKADPDKIPTCEICQPSTKYSKHYAISKCLECSKVLCRSCCETHKITKVTQNHNLFDIDVEKDIQCKIHEEEPIRYYCEPCQMCICVLCTFEEHKNHEITTLNDGLSKHRDSLDSLLQKCKERIDNVKNRLEIIRDCERKIKEAEDVIRDTAINYVSSIRQRERVLKDELRKHYGQDTFDFLEEKHELKETMETLQSTCNLTELVLKDKNIEILLLKKDLQGKLLSMTQETLDHPPKSVQRKVKFIPGTLNLGFLEFKGGLSPNPEFIKKAGCGCNLCIADKIDNYTMTSFPETSSKHTLTDTVQMMKHMTQTDPVTIIDQSDSDLSDADTVSIQSDSNCDELSESLDDSSFLYDSSDTDDTSHVSSPSNISVDDFSKCEATFVFDKKEKSATVNCQTDSSLLDDLLTETNLVFRYNLSKLLPEKKDSGTSTDFENDVTKIPFENTKSCLAEESCLTVKNNRDSVISSISESDINDCLKTFAMNDSGIQVYDSQNICKICQLNIDSIGDKKLYESDLTVEKKISTKDVSTSTYVEQMLDKQSNTDIKVMKEAAMIAKPECHDFGVLKRPHTVSRGVCTESDKGMTPESSKKLTTDRETSPVRINMFNAGTMTRIETRNIGIKVCPKVKNSCVGTRPVILKDKSACTPHVITIEKETSTPQVHLLHKSIGTDIESYLSKADKQTNTIDITQIYLEAAFPKLNIIKKVSRAEGTDRRTSPDSASYVSRGTYTENHVLIDIGTQYEVPKSPERQSSMEEDIKKTGVVDRERPVIQKETEFEPVLVQNGKVGKYSILTGRRLSLPKVIIHTVERGMNTRKVDTHHKGTSTPPRETEDKSVTTGTDLATKVDDKITHCISKLKAVSEKLGHGSKNEENMPVTAANTVTPGHNGANEKPSVVKPKFSILSSLLGRRQSEGDILKAKDRDNSQPKRRDPLARKQTTNMTQMMQTPGAKGGGFFSFSKPKLSLKTQVIPKLGSVEEITVKQDLDGKHYGGRSIPGRPPLPTPNAFKKSPTGGNKATSAGSGIGRSTINNDKTNKTKTKPQVMPKL